MRIKSCNWIFVQLFTITKVFIAVKIPKTPSQKLESCKQVDLGRRDVSRVTCLSSLLEILIREIIYIFMPSIACTRSILRSTGPFLRLQKHLVYAQTEYTIRYSIPLERSQEMRFRRSALPRSSVRRHSPIRTNTIKYYIDFPSKNTQIFESDHFS